MSDLSAVSAPRSLRDSGPVACGVAAVSALRGLWLLLAPRPRTPLRVLCIVAFDTLHVFRCSRRLTRAQVRVLAALLDFGACANAEFDDKPLDEHEYRRARQLLDEAGAGRLVDEYLRRLHELERHRPLAGGDDSRHQRVLWYRESVVRWSLGMVAATAFDLPSVEAGFQTTQTDSDLEQLFRIVMQCQIMDDVLDYGQDVRAGLPGFLTVPRSLDRAFDLVQSAANRYAEGGQFLQSGRLMPLRIALAAVSLCARLTIVLGRRRWSASGQ